MASAREYFDPGASVLLGCSPSAHHLANRTQHSGHLREGNGVHTGSAAMHNPGSSVMILSGGPPRVALRKLLEYLGKAARSASGKATIRRSNKSRGGPNLPLLEWSASGRSLL